MTASKLLVSTRKGLFVLAKAGQRWAIERVSFLGDPVSLALFDRRDATLYAALFLGHFGAKMRRSRDLGESWEEIAAPAFPKDPEGTPEEKFADGRAWPHRVEQVWALEPGLDREAGTLHAGTIGGGVFVSRDRGDTWTLDRGLWDHPQRKEWVGGGADLPGVHSICVDPRDGRRRLVGVSSGGVWETLDDGATWNVRAKGMFAEYMPPDRREDPIIQDPHRVVMCRARPERLWCQHHNGVFRSDDGAASWATIANVAPSVFGFAVAVHPTEPDTAWLVPAVKDEKRVPAEAKVVVARTRDAGKTWTVLREGLPQTHAYDLVYRHALDVDASGARLAMGSTTGSLWITEDGGDAWQEISAHLPPIYAVRWAE